MNALGILGALIEAAAASVSAAVLQMGSNNQSSSPAAVAAFNKEINELWDNLEVFTPHLRKLSQQSTHSKLARQGIPEMASGLLLSIGTRGLSQNRRSKTEELKTSLFEQAMEDVASVMVHVKGHGLLALRRLIEQRDPETVENEVAVLKVFREKANEDSYIYIMSIQGMAALALKWHKGVVPILIKEYDGFTNGDGDDQKVWKEVDCGERIETRMKVGEILVKVVQKLKEIAPSYRVPLTNVFFRVMRVEEPLIQASALANLGELCHLLKFSLGVVLTEVWFCVESILQTEKDIHVRRAALHLLVLLLKGVQNELSASDILGDNTVSQHLRDVRRLLTRIEQCEVELVAKTHCQLALQELELIVKKVLTPSTSLNYKIQILGL